MDGPRQIPLLLSPSFCLGSAREEVIREKALENRARSEQSRKINEHFATISLSDTQCVCLRYPRQSFYPSDPLLSICQDEKSLFAVCHPAHFSHGNPNRGQGPHCRAPPLSCSGKWVKKPIWAQVKGGGAIPKGSHSSIRPWGWSFPSSVWEQSPGELRNQH